MLLSRAESGSNLGGTGRPGAGPDLTAQALPRLSPIHEVPRLHFLALRVPTVLQLPFHQLTKKKSGRLQIPSHSGTYRIQPAPDPAALCLPFCLFFAASETCVLPNTEPAFLQSQPCGKAGVILVHL